MTRNRFRPRMLLAAFVATIMAVAMGLSAPRPAAAADVVDVNVFHSELAPHGRWFSHPRWGYVWTPTVYSQDRSWRPYSRGHWLYTDEHGWYWNSEERWGWATYHYGRWYLDEEDGWIWVPDTTWGPAWVAWRWSDDRVGWAPLPPAARWSDGSGLAFSASFYDTPRYAPAWCFVAPAYLTAPRLYVHIAAPVRNVVYLRRTAFVTRYTWTNRRVFNAGFDLRRYERVVRRPVQRVSVVAATNIGGIGFRAGARPVVNIYRPTIRGSFRDARPANLVDRVRLREERRRQWDDRRDVRQDRRENRQDRREDGRDARQDRREDRRDIRQDKREDRRDDKQTRPQRPTATVTPPKADIRKREDRPKQIEPRQFRQQGQGDTTVRRQPPQRPAEQENRVQRPNATAAPPKADIRTRDDRPKQTEPRQLRQQGDATVRRQPATQPPAEQKVRAPQKEGRPDGQVRKQDGQPRRRPDGEEQPRQPR